jgi:antirestriction protein ArdC
MASKTKTAKSTTTAPSAADKYATVTAKIIAQLEAGVAPWVRPWSITGASSLPCNAVTRKAYRGSNILQLWMQQASENYPTAEWLSFKQAIDLGGSVRKGEKGTPVFFFSMLEKDDDRTESGKVKIPLLRSFTVFNVAQCDNLSKLTRPIVAVTTHNERLADAEAFIAATGSTVRHGGDRAYYNPGTDAIQLPNIENFSSAVAYYGTSLHEHGHWTGAQTRLAREFGKRFGDNAYAAEELVAELTAAFLCAELGIEGQLMHPEYIANWLEVLKGDARAILTAGSRASDAAEYLMKLAGRREEADAIDDESEGDALPVAA